MTTITLPKSFEFQIYIYSFLFDNYNNWKSVEQQNVILFSQQIYLLMRIPRVVFR